MKNYFWKQLFVKPVMSAMIFVAVAILGIRMYAAITSRDELTSTATPANQLTAEKWDSLIDKVRQLEINTDALSGNIDTLSGTIETIYTGITDYVMGADEEYVDNKIDGLNESLTQWANNTFLTGVFTPKVTYYRGIYDEEASLGEKFSKVCDPVGALSLWKLESSRFSDVRIDYCGTSEIYRKDFFYNSEYNSKNPRTARWPAESHDQKTSVFEDTILANHDICMLAGVGGSFYGPGEFIYFTKRESTGKIALHLAHLSTVGGKFGIDFTVACIDFSEKSSDTPQTFTIATGVEGYLRSHCGHTPSCDAGYTPIISGETGDGCGVLKKERAIVCVKQKNSSRSVGGACISSVVSNGSLTSGTVGFKIIKGKVDQYGRCISNGTTAVSNGLNARIDNNRDKNQFYDTLSV